MRNLCFNSGYCPSALEWVKSLFDSFSLPVPTTVLKAHQRVEYAIRDFVNYPALEASVKMIDVAFAAIQENRKQETAVYENGIAELRQQVNCKFTELSDLESNLVSSQG